MSCDHISAPGAFLYIYVKCLSFMLTLTLAWFPVKFAIYGLTFNYLLSMGLRDYLLYYLLPLDWKDYLLYFSDKKFFCLITSSETNL